MRMDGVRTKKKETMGFHTCGFYFLHENVSTVDGNGAGMRMEKDSQGDNSQPWSWNEGAF